MTTEQKAKAYDEALERAKKLHKDAITLQLEQDIKDYEYIFPELAESEGERIRKHLIDCVTRTIPEADAFKEISKEQILAWLEKQGETYTKKDVDDAYLKGVCDAKQELEKQGEKKLANSAKTCKKPQRMVSAEAKEALYDKSATIDIDKMGFIEDFKNYIKGE